MSRGVHADVIAELAKDSFNMAHLIMIDFETRLYLTESPIAISYGGNIFLPSSALKGISNVSETSDIQLGSLTVSLSGVSQEYIAILLSQTYIDRQITINRVLLDDSHVIIGDPITVYDGRIQNFIIADKTNSSAVSLVAASHWADFDKKAGRRTNNNSQKMHFPTDRGFEFAPNTIRDLRWGRI
jgi:hypothetical protein